ncbi:MAG: hypothetical protein QM757_34125 [Paludibaculum sp.]
MRFLSTLAPFLLAVIVKSAREISAIVAENPAVPREDEHFRFLVAFGPDTAG